MKKESDANRPVVLYVDDEPQALKYFAKVFGDAFEILTASSASEARDVLAQRGSDISVVVTDQRMPGETGVTLLQYLRVRHPSIVRFLTTAYTDLRSAVEAVNSGGAYQYVEKPWNFDSLRVALRRAVEFRALCQERDRLLAQKAAIYHAGLAVDRTRSLASVTAAFAEDYRQPFAGLRDYLRRAREIDRTVFEARDVLDDDLWESVHREGPSMTSALETACRPLNALRAPADPRPMPECLESAVQAAQTDLAQSGVSVFVESFASSAVTITHPGRFNRLLATLLSRLSDSDGDDLRISIVADATKVMLSAENRSWQAEQIAALYSLALNRRGRYMGLDMDLFPAYLLAADLGAVIDGPIEENLPASFVITFRTVETESDESVVSAIFHEASTRAEPLAIPSAD